MPSSTNLSFSILSSRVGLTSLKMPCGLRLTIESILLKLSDPIVRIDELRLEEWFGEFGTELR